MDIFERAAAFLGPRLDRQLLVLLLQLALLVAAWPQNLSARQDEQDPAQADYLGFCSLAVSCCSSAFCQLESGLYSFIAFPRMAVFFPRSF
jgi:hypothetical protein